MLASKVFDAYPDSTVVYPGHGDDTTLDADGPKPSSTVNELPKLRVE